MSSDQPFDVDFVTDLVRRQGEELLRVRRELEESQKLHGVLIDASRSIEKQFNDLYKTSIQWHLRLESMTQEFAVLKTGSEGFLAELDAARTAFNTDLLNFGHPSGTLSNYAPATSVNVLDEISSVSEFSVSSLGTANGEKDDDYETVVPPSPALNLDVRSQPTERSNDNNIPVTQEETVTATPARAASVSGERESENYPAGEIDRSDPNTAGDSGVEHAADDAASGTIVPVSNGTPEVSSMVTLNNGASSSPNHKSNKVYGHFSISGMTPVCTKLPKTKAGKAVKAMCRTTIPNAFSAKNGAQSAVNILKHSEALFARPNSRHHTLISISREARDPCTVLKKVNPNWRGHLLVQSSVTGCLFYLGQYQSIASQKITADEYRSLPEESKNYVLNSAKTVRPKEISTQGQLLLSLEKANGIHIAKTELQFVECSKTIEAKLRAEARQKGYGGGI
ncbi:hypothetical protein BDP27DRAFT_1445806 [Rhodocollybia butyracea]|uniref:Uncharacterized protein n=1 Tax=Rhodocollybia butyracea TaxID=206335 RepID=A0A9P5U9T9_9AGAR|nr:hypothetical protein BDP27DRAFT_1445806 [Rhodocollybia butyracea]